MCYSGKCQFENYMGDCTLPLQFTKHFGWGCYESEETEEEYHKRVQKLARELEQWRSLRR